MQYSLTISQKAICENFPTLDIKDAAIIDFLSKFAHSPSIQKKIEGKTVFYWFDYGKIAEENPLIKLDPESIRRRVRALCSLEILAAHPMNRGGKVFFSFGKKYYLTHSEGRADLPDVPKEVGQKIPKGRANLPEVGAKGRADLPDNQYTSIINIPDNNKGAAAENASSPLEAEKEKTPPPPTPAPASPQPEPFGWVNIEKELERMAADELVLENFRRRSGLLATAFPVYISDFSIHAKGEERKYRNSTEIRSHFYNWCAKRSEKETAKKPATQKSSGLMKGMQLL